MTHDVEPYLASSGRGWTVTGPDGIARPLPDGTALRAYLGEHGITLAGLRLRTADNCAAFALDFGLSDDERGLLRTVDVPHADDELRLYPITQRTDPRTAMRSWEIRDGRHLWPVEPPTADGLAVVLSEIGVTRGRLSHESTVAWHDFCRDFTVDPSEQWHRTLSGAPPDF